MAGRSHFEVGRFQCWETRLASFFPALELSLALLKFPLFSLPSIPSIPSIPESRKVGRYLVTRLRTPVFSPWILQLMKLDDAQKQKVSDWIEQGLKLSEIQDKLNSEFGMSMTYMEVRFLIDDLGVKLKDKPREAPVDLKTPGPTPPPLAKGPSVPPEPANDLVGGGVSVTVDQVTRPGSLVSGKVKFSDGKSADWHLDQMGRLGLAPKEQGYKPSQEDLMEFQAELQNELARLGF